MKYFRMGEIPTNEKSIIWEKLTYDQRTDLDGNPADIEKTVDFLIENARSWKGVDKSEIFENGVSVFETNGTPVLPDIKNIAQARSLSARLDDTPYIVDGEQIGTGADGEPLVINCKVEKAQTTKKDLVNLLIGVLSGYFAEREGNYDESKTGEINTFYDVTSGENYITFAGYEFKSPVSEEWRP